MSRLDEIEKYTNAATSGPWWNWVHKDGVVEIHSPAFIVATFGDLEDMDAEDHANVEFITNIRTDAPLLLAVARAAQNLVDSWHDEGRVVQTDGLEGNLIWTLQALERPQEGR